MGLAVVGTAAALVGIVFPGTTAWAIAGVAVGAAVGALLFATRSASGARAAFQSVGRLLVVVALVAGVVALSFAASSGVPLGSNDDGDSLRRPTPVRAVQYAATFEHEGGLGVWRGREVMRVRRADLIRSAKTPFPGRRIATPALLRRALGDGWRFAGDRGRRGDVYVYVRTRAVAVEEPELYRRPLRRNRVTIGAIGSELLDVRFVPRDGSAVELRAPAGLVHATDPESERREFGGEDIVTVVLGGLEDDPDRRAVELEIANFLGRTSFYRAADDATAWGVSSMILGLVLSAAAGFFVKRYLERRFPSPKAT